jgi:hypothetical protein
MDPHSYMLLQLQGLVYLALENMTSLFGSLTTTVDEMIPSLRKLRKLAGTFSEGHCWPLIDARCGGSVLNVPFLFGVLCCFLQKNPFLSFLSSHWNVIGPRGVR